ncbi:hypothetical protein ACFCWB_11465 [Streptomyces bacillaris]|uniref:hypothetical protein n=1 Tax=Streptomyces bacillaris TaxID=68179 RepID=UPI0035DE1EE9
MLPLNPDPPVLGPAQTGPPHPPAAHQDGLGETAVEPLALWWQVWAWSPVLPAPVLDGFTPLLHALRRLHPADPRTAARPRSRHHTALALDDLLDAAAKNGPLTAAAALATAPDAGASGYAMMLHRLVGADPGAWTADVPAVLGALALPELGAFYLAAATHHPDAFPNGLAEPVHAALTLTSALPPPADPHAPDAAECVGRAWSNLLDHVWHTGSDLDGALPTILDRLHTLAAPLTRPTTTPPPTGTATPTTPVGRAPVREGELSADLTDTHPAVLALRCILSHAAAQATKDKTLPGAALQLVADVLAARGDETTVAATLGAHLPLLHHHAPAFTTAHPDLYAIVPGTPSPAAAWLADGPGLDPPLHWTVASSWPHYAANPAVAWRSAWGTHC